MQRPEPHPETLIQINPAQATSASRKNFQMPATERHRKLSETGYRDSRSRRAGKYRAIHGSRCLSSPNAESDDRIATARGIWQSRPGTAPDWQYDWLSNHPGRGCAALRAAA